MMKLSSSAVIFSVGFKWALFINVFDKHCPASNCNYPLFKSLEMIQSDTTELWLLHALYYGLRYYFLVSISSSFNNNLNVCNNYPTS